MKTLTAPTPMDLTHVLVDRDSMEVDSPVQVTIKGKWIKGLVSKETMVPRR